MPDAVSDRPPRKGPMARYFIPLNSGSPSFLSRLASSAVWADVWVEVLCSACFLTLLSRCCERAKGTNKTIDSKNAAVNSRTRCIMNSSPGEELVRLMVKPSRQTDNPIIRFWRGVQFDLTNVNPHSQQSVMRKAG